MMRYEESGDFTTTLHRRLLYILNENLPGSTSAGAGSSRLAMNWNPMKQDSASTMAFLTNWKNMECSRWSRSITMSCRLHWP